ncbi:MAG: D-lyxose/D-mannose family sugar isomerase [Myxococcota bacterium]
MLEDPGFDFRELFVLDLANNHQGSVDHGRAVIRSVAEVVEKHDVRAAIKFQFRQLETFIHPDHREHSDLKYIQRFRSTRLERGEFQALLNDVRATGLLAACTPFDEESLGVIAEMDFDLIKVASCSATDWPLLERIADTGKPVICSTGGLTLHDIDRVVSFFQHRAVHFALMHCVAIYPTPDERLCLHQIRTLRERFPDVPIGWSTHESPGDTVPVGVALALGAELFERHVGLATDEVNLNAYSSTPEELSAWLAAHARAKILLGPVARPASAPEEREALAGLQRGIYARGPIRAGARIDRGQVYFAMPWNEGQLASGAWREGITARGAIERDAPLLRAHLQIPDEPESLVLKRAVHEAKALLNEARIAIGHEFKVEFSHHYGVPGFRETGAIIIECINREYCKKLVLQLPGQSHPSHYHARKEETFQVLYGVLRCRVGGIAHELHPGESVLVLPGVWHSFSTETGVVFEEVSTTHYNDDSFYEDKRINHMQRAERKTVVDHWGRFQIAELPVRLEDARSSGSPGS